MESFLDTQSLSTAASSSTPHTPSPSMNEPTATTAVPNPAEYGGSSGHYYLDYQQHSQQHSSQQPPPMLSIEISHPSSATAGPLYRRASFPFVQHDHSMSHYPKYADLNEESHSAHPRYEYEDHSQQHQDHSATTPAGMIVPTQIPQGVHQQHLFYRPSSSSSSVSSVSAPPSGFLNPAMSSIPVMHTDDAASKETQYLRRKCFNCGTTEPPSWRRSTLNPGKIVCNKCGLYERTHNKPRPHQFGLRPGNKTRKQPQQQQQQPQQPTGKLSGVSSPSSSPKRHGMAIKKEQLDYSQAMRRGSIASINSGSGASDWDDHSGYSTASSAYHSSLGMGPPYGQQQQQQQQQHALSHHQVGGGAGGHSSHVPSHHGHHPYNSAYSMPPPPRSTSHGIRLPQAPPMKVPSTGNKAGSSSPVAGPGVNVISGGGNNSHSNQHHHPHHHHAHLPHIHTNGNARHSSSPDNNMGIMLSPSSALGGSPYASAGTGNGNGSGPSSGVSVSSGSNPMYSPNTTAILRGPSPLAPPTADYYARRGSTSQIPHHHHHSSSSLYHEDHLSTMRRGSVGAIGMGAPGAHGMGYGAAMQQQQQQHARALPPPSSWNAHYQPLAEMSLTPTPVSASVGRESGSGGSNSADSTPQQGCANVHSAGGAADLTPSPPSHHSMMMQQQHQQHQHGSTSASPIGVNIQPEIASLTV